MSNILCKASHQHAAHANARGSGGMPPRKFCKIGVLRSNVKDIL